MDRSGEDELHASSSCCLVAIGRLQVNSSSCCLVAIGRLQVTTVCYTSSSGKPSLFLHNCRKCKTRGSQ